MKKMKYLVLSLGLAIGIVGCEDAYEIEPIGILDEQTTFFEIDDAQIYLNGIYSMMANTTEIAFTSIFTDELAPSFEWNGSNRDTHQMILNSTNGYASGIWLNGHATVNRVNRLLKGVELLVPTTEGQQTQLNDVVAQAKFIRAYAYLNLISYFSTNMTDNSALGVMLFTHVPASNEVLPRATNGEIYALMESDLEYAFNNLTSHSYIYPTKAAVEAVQARMYAYRGMYDKAKIHAGNVINNYGLSLTIASPYVPSNFYHAANSTNPYRRIWADIPMGNADQGEQILTLRSLVGGTPTFQPASIFYQNSTKCSGSPLWTMGYKVYDSLNTNANDIRLYAFIDPTSFQGSGCNNGEIMIDKYPGNPGNGLGNSLKLIRLSEMYMIMAEAAAAANDFGGVATYIHAVEAARAIDGNAAMPSYSNATDAWAAILNERRLEFFIEGFRYVDLRRLGAKAGKTIDRDSRDNELPSEPTTLPIDDHRFTLPIPLDETNVNSLIIQNPGY